LQALSYYGHTYRLVLVPDEYRYGIEVEGVPIAISPPYYIESDPFLGFYPDGSFALALRQELPVQGEVQSVQIDRLVHYYSPTGKLLGAARRLPEIIWPEFNHELTTGPDGNVYQLVSNPDHLEQIVRLGFAPDDASLPLLPEPTAIPTPVEFSPRLPAWKTPPAGAGDQEIARETLVSFFALLSEKRYAEAAELYGGDFSENPYERQPGESDAAFWQRVCTANTLCMPVLLIANEEKLSEEEYLFYIEFLWRDGTRFELGACCGASPAQFPGAWQFAYQVKKVDGQWKVMREPLFVP